MSADMAGTRHYIVHIFFEAEAEAEAEVFADGEECAPVVGEGEAASECVVFNLGRHRVVATDQAPGSVWLALFWQGVYAE